MRDPGFRSKPPIATPLPSTALDKSRAAAAQSLLIVATGVVAVCYSAKVWRAYQEFVRRFGAVIDIHAFAALYAARDDGAKIKTTKAMDDAFLRDGMLRDASPEAQRELRGIAGRIAAWNARQAAEIEALLFRQRKRLADAERTLRARTTQKALNDRRIATDKTAWAMGKLADLRRTAPEERDRRIFPGMYAPVMVMERGKRTIKPMRYQCRPAGKPAAYDAKYPGTYNARRDNLEGFWKGQFGRTHGVLVADAFYENVSRHNVEGRALADGETEQNVVLEFEPQPRQDMLIACVYSHWRNGDQELWSFAAITDEPPPEIAAAGHDRCIVPIKEQHIDAWLEPNPKRLDALYGILDDRERPVYEYRRAA